MAPQSPSPSPLSSLPSPSIPSCPHEQRPGTKICLHCRHEARMVAKERRRRLWLRGSAFSAILLLIGSVGTIGAVTFRRYSTPRRAETPSQPQRTATEASPRQDSVVATTPGSAQPAPAAAAPAVPAAPLLKPVLPEGTTTLASGMTATRHDSVVVLSFDFAGARTRIPERFERLVRATLPSLYGARADSAVRAIPDGGIARQGDLFTELAERGVRIPLGAGGAIALYPMSRPGHDGPLVTQYRVTVTKG